MTLINLYKYNKNNSKTDIDRQSTTIYTHFEGVRQKNNETWLWNTGLSTQALVDPKSSTGVVYAAFLRIRTVAAREWCTTKVCASCTVVGFDVRNEHHSGFWIRPVSCGDRVSSPYLGCVLITKQIIQHTTVTTQGECDAWRCPVAGGSQPEVLSSLHALWITVTHCQQLGFVNFVTQFCWNFIRCTL